MKPSWEHAKEEITTDQKNLTDDEHIHEEEKQELKSSEKSGQDQSLIPKQSEKFRPGEKK